MLTQITTYLIDLDGVIYRGEELLSGAKEFIDWLNAKHKKYLFLTNNSFASEAQVLTKLTRLGIQTDLTHVLGAAQAAVQNIAHRFPDAHVYIIGETPLFDMVRTQGLDIANENMSTTNVVLVGLDRMFDYKKLVAAVHAIRAGAAFIAINRDPLLPIAGGILLPGTGSIVAAIEAGSGVKPDVIGKPQPALLQEAMRLLDSQPDETVMVGDGLDTDIQAGKAANTRTLLVFSGKDSRADLAKSAIKPDYTYDSIANVLKELLVN